MFGSLKTLIHQALNEEADARRFSADDHRLALAALLVHLIAVDGVITEDERTRLRQVLSQHYDLDPKETEALVAEARRSDEDAVDLYGFTSVLKRMLDADGRAKAVEMMWELVFADGKISEFEDNMVWRVAELLGVSPRDRIALKKKVEAKLDIP